MKEIRSYLFEKNFQTDLSSADFCWVFQAIVQQLGPTKPSGDIKEEKRIVTSVYYHGRELVSRMLHSCDMEYNIQHNEMFVVDGTFEL